MGIDTKNAGIKFEFIYSLDQTLCSTRMTQMKCLTPHTRMVSKMVTWEALFKKKLVFGYFLLDFEGWRHIFFFSIRCGKSGLVSWKLKIFFLPWTLVWAKYLKTGGRGRLGDWEGTFKFAMCTHEQLQKCKQGGVRTTSLAWFRDHILL